MPIFSFCMNCGGEKAPPYTQHYCDSCETARMSARQQAISAGNDPSAAARAALESRAFSSKSTRPNPRLPFTINDATRAALSVHLPPPPPEAGH